MIERSIELSTHLRNLKPFLIIVSLNLASFIFLYITYQDIAVVSIGLGISMIYVIPTLIVHLNYYKHDKGKRISINWASSSLLIEKGNVRQTINFSDIKDVILTRGVNGSTTFLHKYFYYQFNLINSEVVYLTSLLIKENDIVFRGKISRAVPFPTIRYIEPEENKAKLAPDQNQIENFKSKYQSKGTSELEEIRGDRKFVEEAKIAAIQLLEDRIKMHNS